MSILNHEPWSATTQFTPTSYSFVMRMKGGGNAEAAKAAPFDALRLVWHDYPGDWFTGRVNGAAESRTRGDTFRSLQGRVSRRC